MPKSESSSRSPSPSRTKNIRKKRKSVSKSPKRRKLYSRSRSRSPKRHRSRSHSPRYRDGRRSRRSRTPPRRKHYGNREDPEPCRCLGVFNLSTYTTEGELYSIFKKFGPIEKVSVILDGYSGQSRGFAFIYFEDQKDATDARDELTGIEIDGRKIRVDYSITKRAHSPTPGHYLGSRQDSYRGGGGSSSGSGGRGARRRERYRSPSPHYGSFKRNNYDYNNGYDDGSYNKYRSRSRSYSPNRSRY